MPPAAHVLAVLALIAGACLPALSQSKNLERFFRQSVGLTQNQISEIRRGHAVAKALRSRTLDEVFLFGAVYIHAQPEAYVAYAHDVDRLRRLPDYLALGVFSNPPRLTDLKGFSLDSEDIQALKRCKPGDCLIQAPASSIQELKRSIDWSAPNVNDEVNQRVQEHALQLLLAYQRDGNQVLGVYNDKRNPTLVAQQFAYMLSYDKALPAYLPDFYNYLLAYPNGRTPNIEDTFYWAKVKFGLKPTLRIVQMVTMRGGPEDEVAYAIAEKQLYSNHYFETALDLSFCVRDGGDRVKPGFYLIMEMGSEQAGLTGIKGFIVRKAAVGRSVSSLRDALTTIATALEDKE